MKKKTLISIFLLLLTAVCLFGAVACKKNPDDSKNKHVHAYSVVTISPTCTEKGYTLYKCIGCGDTYTDKEVDTIAHTPVVDKAVEATCSKTGLTEGSHCSVCNATIVEQKVVDKKPHTVSDWIIDEKASCAKVGQKHKECKVCNTTVEQAPIEKTNHTPVVDKAVEATCLKTGLTEGSHCSVCNATIVEQKVVDKKPHTVSDWIIDEKASCSKVGQKHKECKVCNMTVEQAPIEKTDHTPVMDKAVESTCLKTGLTEGSHCSVCNATIVEQKVVDKKPHAVSDWIIDEKASCTKVGQKHKECKVCNTTVEQAPIEKTNHTPVIDKAVEATCLKTGLTEGSHCSACNATIVEQQVTEKSEHVLSDEIIDQAATCFEDGTYHIECTFCHRIMLSATIKAGHNYTNTVVQPTALESGYTKHECTKCGDSYKDNFVDALGTVGLAYTLNEDGTSCTVTGLGGITETQIAIPTSIDGYKVTAIGDKAFSECVNLTKIILADTITSIGRRAFYGCTGLTEIKIPSSVTSIGTQVFFKASNLSTVYYDSSYADSDNPILSLDHVKKIVFNGETVKQYMFVGEQNVEIVIGNSVSTIASYAFKGCSGLTSVTIGNSVTSIGNYAFSGCSKLASITIGNGVTSIGDYAFSGCSSLESITLPFVGNRAGVTEKDTYQYPFGYIFGENYYDGGTKTEQYYYGSSTTSRTSSYYYIPSSLKSVTITGGNILYGAFDNCSGLTSITIPDSVTSIGNYAFYNCRGLTSITIPDSVTSIGNYAFYNCRGLTSITIPDSVTSIGDYAFNGCSGLKGVYISDIAAWCNIEFGYYDSNPLYYAHNLYLNNALVTDLVIPNTVTAIKYRAFYGATCLQSVTIPDSVNSIGSSAFAGCSGLENITIPDSVTSIGSYAFSYCSGLTSVTIPDSVTSIGYEAFYNCSGLTSITIPDSVTSIGSYAFSGCPIETATIAAIACSYIKNSKLKTVVITSGAVIGNYAFSDCSGLTSVTIPDSVTSIGDEAFYNCSKLTSITIGNSVTSIGSSAFSGCYKLVEVINKSRLNITKGSDSNGYVAYYALNVKTEGTSDIVNINNYLFYTYDNVNYLLGYVGNDTELVLPDNYNGQNYVINQYAFYNCSGLTSITIPDKVTSIGFGAFSGCSSLESITLPFVGNRAGVTAKDTYQYPFGCIFGTSSYTGGTQTQQYYYGNSTTSTTSSYYYIPSSLKSVTITGGDILYGAFYNCSGLTSITIPDSITSIGNDAFDGCNNLKYNEYDNAYYLGNVNNPYVVLVKAKDTSITSCTINDKTKVIYQSAFYNCSGLKGVYISDIAAWCNIEFGDNPLGYAHNLYLNNALVIDLVIPNTVTVIKKLAFYNATCLQSVTIGNSVTSIGDRAFYNCSGLTSVTIGNSVTSIGDRAFYNCSGLTSVTIGNSVTSIGDYAFRDCYKLVEVVNKSKLNITKGSSDNGDVAAYALNVKTEGTSDIVNVNDYLFYTYNNVNYLLGYVGNDTELVLLDNYNGQNYVINQYAFYNCRGFTSIIIPDSVTSIGKNAFYGCTIEVATIPTIAIPYIENANLKTVTITSGTSIGSYAFYGCTGLTSITIGNGVTTIGSYAFYNCKGLTSITIPDSVTSIGSSAFSGCSGLESVTIGNSVTSIGTSAFSGCSGLKGVYISDIAAWCNIEFGNYASNPLYYAHNLYLNNVLVTDLVIPNSVTTIKNYAFYGASCLQSVTIPNSVTSIGRSAFIYCSGLTSITIPDSVTSIGSSTFYNCSGLTSVTIPNSVTSIGGSAFYNCTSLKKVYFTGSAEEWKNVKIERYNSSLTSATVYYYSTEEPTAVGNYWHYDSTGKVVEW